MECSRRAPGANPRPALEEFERSRHSGIRVKQRVILQRLHRRRIGDELGDARGVVGSAALAERRTYLRHFERSRPRCAQRVETRAHPNCRVGASVAAPLKSDPHEHRDWMIGWQLEERQLDARRRYDFAS